MSIGSFLATAGLAGQSMRAEEAAMREAQQQQLALEALNRQEKARREVNALPPAALAAPDFKLGAPLQVIEPEVIKDGRAGVELVSPEGLPATTAGIKTDTAPVTAAKSGRTPVKLDGVVIPSNTAGGKVRLHDGVGGFTKVDPNASDYTKMRIEGRNNAVLTNRLNKIAGDLGSVTRGVLSPFTKQDEKQRGVRKDSASTWYRSDVAKRYFSRNPEMVAVAEKNPLGFYGGVAKANRAARESAAAPATKKAAAPPVTGAQTVKVGGAQVDISSYINKMRGAESGGVSNPYQTANLDGASSAYGAFQFTDGTWVDTYKKANPDTPLSRAAILKRREEPAQQDRMALKFTEYNAQYLNKAGMPINDTTLYLAHFLGKAGAVKLLGADAKAPVSGVLDADQITANPRELKGRNVEQVVNWAASKMQGGASTTGGAPAPSGTTAGVQLASAAAETPVPERIDPSNFYRGSPDAVPRDMQVALQKRTRLAQMAGAYQRSGMGAEYLQATMAVEELDNSLAFLQGMQGINELAMARDPRRLAAVWSYYTGVPVQLQPQTDGTYNVMVNNSMVQRGVSPDTIINSARSAFDTEYRNAQTASASAMAQEQFKSNLKIGEQAAKTLGDLTSALEQEKLKGANAAALKELENDLKRELELQNPEAKVTMTGDGTGSAILSYKDGRVATFNPGGDIEINGQTVKTAPSIQAVARGVGN